MSGDYPKTLHHPAEKKGTATAVSGKDPVTGRPFTDYQGTPDQLPPVTVQNGDQEAFYRARGYLLGGEAPPPPAAYAEYPIMLVHPDHQDAIPDDFTVEKTKDGQIIHHRIPGKPERLLPVAVNGKAEEDAWGAKGYRRAGSPDPDAIRTAEASPYDPTRSHIEWPKMVDGVVVDPDADTGGVQEYPKWVGDRIVNTAAEEFAITGKRTPLAKPAELCVICGEAITDDDPRGEGAKGAYHLAHMVPASALQDDDEEPATDQVPGRALLGNMRGSEKKKAAWARKKAERENAAKAQE